jgi:hypothetical protein
LRYIVAFSFVIQSVFREQNSRLGGNLWHIAILPNIQNASIAGWVVANPHLIKRTVLTFELVAPFYFGEEDRRQALGKAVRE